MANTHKCILGTAERCLFHTIFFIPPTFHFSCVNYLPRMVSIMRTNMCNGRIPGGQLFLIGCLHCCFPCSEYAIQLLYCGIPCMGIYDGKCFLIITVKRIRFFPVEFIKRLFVPEDKVCCKLCDGMIVSAVFPVGLLRCKPCYGSWRRYKPVFYIMRCFKLFQQY